MIYLQYICAYLAYQIPLCSSPNVNKDTYRIFSSFCIAQEMAFLSGLTLYKSNALSCPLGRFLFKIPNRGEKSSLILTTYVVRLKGFRLKAEVVQKERLGHLGIRLLKEAILFFSHGAAKTRRKHVNKTMHSFQSFLGGLVPLAQTWLCKVVI